MNSVEESERTGIFYHGLFIFHFEEISTSIVYINNICVNDMV